MSVEVFTVEGSRFHIPRGGPERAAVLDQLALAIANDLLDEGRETVREQNEAGLLPCDLDDDQALVAYCELLLAQAADRWHSQVGRAVAFAEHWLLDVLERNTRTS